ncbi:MAG: ABC transporter ATP-binding protein [Clostridiales bacterium]|nr:ABC transporter ATP-binding protein [Clostridiales bacterium]
MKIVSAANLKKYYGTEPNLTKALDGVSLEIEAGEFAAIVGSSGSGKTTLLNMLGALDRPDSGTVTIDGSELTAMSEEERTVFRRRKIGFVFQNYNLVPILSVYENIVLPLELDGQPPQADWISQVIDALGLTEKADAMPNTLSGGQQQRVAIARALAARPSLLLADEPTGNLDSKTGQDVMRLMLETSRQYQQTILLITHNDQIARMADRVFHLEDGRIRL